MTTCHKMAAACYSTMCACARALMRCALAACRNYAEGDHRHAASMVGDAMASRPAYAQHAEHKNATLYGATHIEKHCF